MKYPLPPPSLQCFCGRVYNHQVDLNEHRIARGHFPSHRCNALCQHPPARPHPNLRHTCGSCGKQCERLDILEDHGIATGHSFCADCDRTFSSPLALEKHRSTVVHASEFKCCDCAIFFKDVYALVAHMERRAHRKPLQKQKAPQPKKTVCVTDADVTCKECGKTFKTADALRAHSRSVKHKPLSNLTCPLGKNCRGTFTAPSALLHHLESGKCQSGMDQEEVLRMVQACDGDGVIHTPRALTASSPSSMFISAGDTPSATSESWAVSSDAGSEWSLLTPALSRSSTEVSWEPWSLLSPSHNPLRDSLSTSATVSSTLHCPLCPKSRKSFTTPLSLQQHLASPFHSAKIYHCPKNLPALLPGKEKNHGKQFSTLSGLAQHLEAGACRGGRKALLVCVNVIQDRLEQLGFGGVRVLLPDA